MADGDEVDALLDGIENGSASGDGGDDIDALLDAPGLEGDADASDASGDAALKAKTAAFLDSTADFMTSIKTDTEGEKAEAKDHTAEAHKADFSMHHAQTVEYIDTPAPRRACCPCCRPLEDGEFESVGGDVAQPWYRSPYLRLLVIVSLLLCHVFLYLSKLTCTCEMLHIAHVLRLRCPCNPVISPVT